MVSGHTEESEAGGICRGGGAWWLQCWVSSKVRLGIEGVAQTGQSNKETQQSYRSTCRITELENKIKTDGTKWRNNVHNNGLRFQNPFLNNSKSGAQKVSACREDRTTGSADAGSLTLQTLHHPETPRSSHVDTGQGRSSIRIIKQIVIALK